jgi:hypothetical protein
MTDAPLDIVYIFQHSRHGDEEIRYSLRSVAANLPFIRKVWIFGDKPAFLSADKSIVEHVPHAYIAQLIGCKLPVQSEMYLFLLASLLPDLSNEFVKFSDDYFILQPLTREQLCRARALEDLSALQKRGDSPWKRSLWRAFDVLKQYGYPGYNFESHVPAPVTKKMVFEVFMAFRPFLSEVRHESLPAATLIYNYALKHLEWPFVWIRSRRLQGNRLGNYFSASMTPLSAPQCAIFCRIYCRSRPSSSGRRQARCGK